MEIKKNSEETVLRHVVISLFNYFLYYDNF